jgi:hypothetical protein
VVQPVLPQPFEPANSRPSKAGAHARLWGILLDFWLHPSRLMAASSFGDVGLPGPDAGKGGKFLLLPPGYKGEVPEGCYVYRSGTNNVFIFLRGFYRAPKNLVPALALIEQPKIYPLPGKEKARPMVFPNASEARFHSRHLTSLRRRVAPERLAICLGGSKPARH